MKAYKAVFIDLDGTLLNHRSEISPENTACIHALVKKGIQVVFATGRPIESVRHLLGAVHKEHPVITLSGSAIHKSLFGEALALHTLPFETVHSILEICRKSHDVANILMNDEHEFFALHSNPEIEEFIGMFRKHPKAFSYDDIPKVAIQSMLVHAKVGRKAVYDLLQRDFADKVHFTYFKEYPWIEIGHLTGNKGEAMGIVCQHLGLDVADAVAIGDGANDLEMIAQAGLGIAMDNADDEIKAVADRRAPHHHPDGVARALSEVFAL
jgi:Cof subfamily protein (haloacid dehalogenase superfamily)